MGGRGGGGGGGYAFGGVFVPVPAPELAFALTLGIFNEILCRLQDCLFGWFLLYKKCQCITIRLI